jgi:heme exporter protein D
VDLGTHAAFIVAAYAVAVLIVGGMVIWVAADHRALARTLADLEARGVTRRSAKAAE